jgi:hypothetical protein
MKNPSRLPNVDGGFVSADSQAIRPFGFMIFDFTKTVS